MTDPHTIWAASQLAPGEGIEDGVERIAALSVDCRTCARCYPTRGHMYGCNSVVACTNADRYQPLPVAQLWKKT